MKSSRLSISPLRISLYLLLAAVLVTSLVMGLAGQANAADPTTIDSATMVFRGTLTDDGDGSYSGTIALIDEAGTSLGDGVTGFDVYARNGAAGMYDKAGSGTQDYANGRIVNHDIYTTAGGWGEQYDPDCADYEHYQLKLDGDNWALEYVSGGTAYASPMSGQVDWDFMYALETGAGAYYAGKGTPESGGYALTNELTGTNNGVASWDMDWSWGSEYVPLAYPGFDVNVSEDGGVYTVTLTPADGRGAGVDAPGPVVNDATGESFGTIQSAINAASPNDTINVAAGAYDETIVVDVAGLTINGAGAASTTIDGSDNGVVVNITTSNVTFSGFTVTGSGANVEAHAGIILQGVTGCTIENNVVSGNAANGIAMAVANSNVIRNNITNNNTGWGIVVVNPGTNDAEATAMASTANIIEGNISNGNGAEGVYLDIRCNNNIVTGNTLTGNTGSGIHLYEAHHTTITGNTITGNTQSGIYIKSHDNTVTGNTITGNNTGDTADHAGIYVKSGYVDHQPGTPMLSVNNTINGNTVANNNRFGIFYEQNEYEDDDALVIDATLNWWGDASGPFHAMTNVDGLGNAVSDNVLFDPWYDSDAMTNLVSDAPIYNVTQGIGYYSIQVAIDGATDGDEITVAAGTYTEQVTITQSLSLIGDGAATTIIQAPDNGRALIAPGTYSWDYVVAADGNGSAIDVRIEGFTIDANAQNGEGTECITGVFLRDVAGTNSGVFDCVINNFGDYYGGWVGSTYNTFTGSDGIVAYGTNSLTIDGNEITDYTVAGLNLRGTGSNYTVSDNSIDGTDSSYVGVYVYQATASVTNNEITNHNKTVNSIGVYLFEAATGVSISQGNTINNNYIGVFLAYTDGATIDGNIINGSTLKGIVIQQDSDNNAVSNNEITMAAGTTTVSSAINVGGDSGGNVIGGDTAAEGNDITMPAEGAELYAIHIGGADTDNVTVKHNTITGGQRAVQFDGGPGHSGTNTVSNNTITGAVFGGIMSSCYGNFVIENNTISNTPRPLEFQQNGNGDIEITGNTLTSTNFDVINAGSFNSMTVTGNSLVGPGHGLNNRTATLIDATHNWWGAASGPYHATTNVDGTGSVVSDNVLFDPWYTDESMASTGSDKPVHNVTQDTYYDTISAAITAANNNDIIVVAPGLYQERVIIDKPLQLLGATWDVDKAGYTVPASYAWDTTVESVIMHPDLASGYDSIVDIYDVDGVTFKGFVVQELNASGNLNTSLVRVRAQTQNVTVNIQHNVIGPNTNTTSQDGTHGRMGLYLVNNPYSDQYGIVDSLITGNKIFGCEGNGDNVFIWSSYDSYGAAGPASMTGTQITYNEIYGAHRSGIEIAGGVSDLVIWRNEIYNNGGPGITGKPDIMFGNGILMVRGSGDRENIDGLGPVNVTIQGNEIYDNAGYGVYMGPNNDSVTITNNNITGNGNGGVMVDLIGNYFNPDFETTTGPFTNLAGSTNIIVNDNAITNNTGNDIAVNGVPSNGFVLDATDNWWGSVNGPTHASNTFNVGGQGSTVSDSVVFAPWLDSGIDNDLTSAGFQPATGTSFAPVVNSGNYYASIQAAVDAAHESQTITVAAGTYTEGKIVIDANLTINGAAGSKPVINPAANLTGNNAADAWFLVGEGVTFNLNNVVIHGSDKWIHQAIRSHGNTTITNVDFLNIQGSLSGSPYRGIAVQSFGGTVPAGQGSDSHSAGLANSLLTVNGCTFQQIGRIGILVKGTGSTAVIDDIAYTGKGDGNFLDYGVEAGAGGTMTVTNSTITGNRGVAATDGSTSAGILVTDYFGTGTVATIEENTLTGNYAGVTAGYLTADVSVVTVHNNDLSGNTDFGVESTNPQVDATYNWWGNASGPNHASNPGGTGNAVSDNVSFNPWWADFEMTTPAEQLIIVSIADIPGVIAPATGGTPVTEITPTAQYTGSVTWTPADAVFQGEQIYTATITLTAADGYTFNGVTADFFTVDGADTATNAADSGVVTGVFPATGPNVLETITVSPSTASTPAGSTVQFIATGTYTDGTTAVITNDVTWTRAFDGEVEIASINSTDEKGLASALAEGTANITAQLDGKTGTAVMTVTAPMLTSIEISGDNTVAAGNQITKELELWGRYTNGDYSEITSGIVWTSQAPAIATVDSSGRVTGKTKGTAFIKATHKGFTDILEFTVTDPVLDSLTILPANPTVTHAGTLAFTAVGNYSDGSSEILTTGVTWSSGNTDIATIDAATGLATTVSAGTCTIQAHTDPTGAWTTQLTVTDATLQTITIEPATANVPKGKTQQYTATGTYSDTTQKDITSMVTWNSSAPGVATINAAGLATAVAGTGTTNITATLDGVTSDTAVLTAAPAEVTSIAVTPANSTLPLGRSRDFTATGTFSDGTTAVLANADLTWSTSNEDIATNVANRVTGTDNGTVTVNVQHTTPTTNTVINGSTPLTISDPVVESLAITGGNTVAAGGAINDLQVIATLSDGSTAPGLASGVTWTVSNTAAGYVTPFDESVSRFQSTAQGTTNLVASVQGKTSPAFAVTVTAPTVVSISVDPTGAVIPAGTTRNFRAVATMSDGSKQIVTTQATWASNAEGFATVSTTGVVSGVATGTATISATFSGQTGQVTVDVTAADLTGITVTPVGGSVAAGKMLQYTATGTYSDLSTANITNMVVWSSSNTTRATVNQAGLATGRSVGTANIVATLGAISGQAAINVTPATLESITVNPANPTLTFISGAPPTLQFTATGIYSDGSTTNLTTTAAWASSSGGVATINGGTGLATTAGAGTTNITATSGGKTGTTVLTVKADTVAPKVTITSPKEGLTTGTRTLVVSGNINDVNAAPRQLLVNGVVVVPNLTLDGNGNFNAGVTLNDGNNRIVVTATDPAGNKGASSTVTVKVDPQKPTVTITSPVDGLLTNNTNVTITGTATHIDGVTSVNVVVNGVSTSVPVAGGAFTTTATLASGNNIISATGYATGHDGEAAYLGASGARTVRVDITAPIVKINNPVNDSVVSVASLNIEGTIDDTQVTTARVSLNGGAPVTVTVVNGSFSTVANLVNGLNTISVTATDAAGNTSSAGVLASVTLDTSKPGVILTSPQNNLRTNAASQTIAGEVSDPTIETVTVTVNGTAATVPVIPDGNIGRFSTVRTLVEGNNTIEVTATNRAVPPTIGASGVYMVTLDTTAPTATISLSDPTDVVTITVTSSESLQGLPFVIVDSTEVVMAPAGGLQWTGTYEISAPGNYDVVATLTDTAGNNAAATASFAKGGMTNASSATVTSSSTTLQVETNGDVSGDISVATHLDNPAGNAGSPEGAGNAAGAYVEINADPDILNNLSGIYVEVSYDPAQLPAGTDESTLKLYLWDVETGTWKVVPGSGVDTERHVIYATLTHLSKYGSFGGTTYTPPPPQPPAPSGGFPAPPPEVPAGTTDVRGFISSEGRFTSAVSIIADDQGAVLEIPEGTVGLTADLEPIEGISMVVAIDVPAPPQGAHIIGVAWDFGPDGATFEPAVNLTMPYDPASLPDGVAEEDLVVAWYNTATGEWVMLETTVDTVHNMVTAKVTHFTTFGLVAVEAEEPAITPTTPAVTPTTPVVTPTTPAVTSTTPAVTSTTPVSTTTQPAIDEVEGMAWWWWLIIGIGAIALIAIGIVAIRNRRD